MELPTGDRWQSSIAREGGKASGTKHRDILYIFRYSSRTELMSGSGEGGKEKKKRGAEKGAGGAGAQSLAKKQTRRGRSRRRQYFKLLYFLLLPTMK